MPGEDQRTLVAALLEVLIDPTVIFCVSCILTPLWVARGSITKQDVVEYFTEPSMAIALALIPICWTVGKVLRYIQLSNCRRQQRAGQSNYTRTITRPLTYGERTRARWYLLNGIIIHMLMDGCVGVMKTSRLFAQNYAKLDKRYAANLGTFEGSAVHVVSLVELLVKGPVCIILYWAFVTRHPARDALEFFTCVTQVYGTVVYLGQEAISGARHVDVDYGLTFTPHYLLYFWFAIFFGCALYLIVPTVLGWFSFLRLSLQCEYTQRYAVVRVLEPEAKRSKQRPNSKVKKAH